LPWQSNLSKQVGQLSQTNRAATWTISDKIGLFGLSAKSVHLTPLYGAKKHFDMMKRLGKTVERSVQIYIPYERTFSLVL